VDFRLSALKRVQASESRDMSFDIEKTNFENVYKHLSVIFTRLSEMSNRMFFDAQEELSKFRATKEKELVEFKRTKIITQVGMFLMIILSAVFLNLKVRKLLREEC